MFVFDILVLLISYIIAKGFVLYNKSLNSVLIPMPVNNEWTFGKQIEFKFIKYSESKQSEGGDVLVLMLFIIISFLAKIFFSSGEPWTVFWTGLAILTAFQLLAIFNMIIIIFFVFIYAIPWLIAGLIFGFDQNFRWTGLIAGIIPGLYGGFFLGRNYFLAKAKLKHELLKKCSITGAKIGKTINIIRKFKFFWFTIAPVFTILTIVSFFSDSQSLIANYLAIYSTEYQILAYIIWIFISLNVFVFSVPMLIEMLQQGTWFTAGVFNKHVVESNEITVKNAYLDKKGKYLAFGFGTTFILAIIALSLGVLIAGEILNKLINANFNNIKTTNQGLLNIAELLSGFICSINVGFLLSLIGNSRKLNKFTIRNIKNPKGLIDKILFADDSVSKFIRENFSLNTIKNLEKSKNSEFMGKSVLVSALNKICKMRDFYTPERFSEYKIPDEFIQSVFHLNPQRLCEPLSPLLRGTERKRRGLEIYKANRLLLEWIYSEFLVEHKVSQQIKSAKESIEFMAEAYNNSEQKFSIVTGSGFYVHISKL